MFKNYIKIAWRNIWNSKIFSAINIISLAIGFSASFVIGLMVYYDFTFDDFHKNANNIYRIKTVFNSPEGTYGNAGVSIPLHQVVKEEIADVEQATTLYTGSFINVKNTENGIIFKEPEYTVFTDPEYFDVFQYNWLAGSPQTSLGGPNKVVLTQARAEKYFPNIPAENLIGKQLVYNDSILVEVSGIVANFTKRTDFIFEEFFSLETAKATDMSDQVFNDNWGSTSNSSQLFVRINKKTPYVLQKKLNDIAAAHESDYNKQMNIQRLFKLQPLKELHFDQELGIFSFTEYTSNKSAIWGLSIIAVFLLLLGCVNFINLNTAQATQRAKEIGIRKTLGSSKKQLVMQFMGETLVLTILSAIISILLSYWLLKVFSDFIPAGLSFSVFKEPLVLVCGVLLILFVTLLSGVYPSIVLTRFKPVRVLKNQVTTAPGKAGLRKFLTVFQFTIAQGFLIATLLVSKQTRFLMQSDMGFRTQAIGYVQAPWSYRGFDKNLVLYNKLKRIPAIDKISMGGMPPASNSTHSSGVNFMNGDREINTEIEFLYGDSAYLNIYEIPLLAGRLPLNDTIKELVINETALNALGFQDSEKALGQILKVEDDYRIVGVMKDFNQRSLRSGINPMALTGDTYRKDWPRFRDIHIMLPSAGSGQLQNTITQIEKAYNEVFPGENFEMHFVDESIKRFYQSESRLSTLLNWAMGLSILICSLGLLGLVLYTINRRTKEIGIRKVLGASLAQLNLLLCKDFLVLVLIAFVIAAPIAGWLLNEWLQDFAYRTELSWWVFALSAIGMLVFSTILISFRTIKTALKNPVNSLRTE
ncbi:ABC transporter permease [Zunongwangia pacifica]|uniref:ABC transporter permease n=1 Tax=Zunongwangia pacifica TaxID=2911062 RepID=A0A9X1ZSQ9_9FLAO|nr:FtsX-like permease family protein [Zunongwangia pacifica]MCL6216983.1 ABC transporter permease [Zunongwangia pacifica]